MPVYDNVRTISKMKVDGKLYIEQSTRRTTQVIAGSGAILETMLYETVIFTSASIVTYTLPTGTADDDGATCTFVNGGGGLKTIALSGGNTIDGGATSITLTDQHDHTTLRYVHANTTWYRL